jgi:hypothetical protein
MSRLPVGTATDQLALSDRQIRAVDGDGVAEGLAQAFDAQFAHGRNLPILLPSNQIGTAETTTISVAYGAAAENAATSV